MICLNEGILHNLLKVYAVPDQSQHQPSVRDVADAWQQADQQFVYLAGHPQPIFNRDADHQCRWYAH